MAKKTKNAKRRRIEYANGSDIVGGLYFVKSENCFALAHRLGFAAAVGEVGPFTYTRLEALCVEVGVSLDTTNEIWRMAPKCDKNGELLIDRKHMLIQE